MHERAFDVCVVVVVVCCVVLCLIVVGRCVWLVCCVVVCVVMCLHGVVVVLFLCFCWCVVIGVVLLSNVPDELSIFYVGSVWICCCRVVRVEPYPMMQDEELIAIVRC